MSKIFYDIIPPKRNRRKFARKISHIFQPDFTAMKTSIIKIVALLVIIGLNWSGLSSVYYTFAYYNDTENSSADFTAGAIDFELGSPSDFMPSAISSGETATRDIAFINNANFPKYNITADNFSGQLCEYLNLEAKLDNGDILYSGSLLSFIYGPIDFEEPDNWSFALTLPADAPESAQGQTCGFDFVFFGSQIKNNLPFGQGFNDTEKISNSIASKSESCFDTETRSKGYWKNHLDITKLYLPQMLGDEIVNNISDVYGILMTDYSNSMRDKLRGQLLGMKFNVAHFNAGEYFIASEGKTINQIIAEADDLLRQNPLPPNSVLEEMKDLLESLVDLQINICTETEVKVLIPNGGEKWWVGEYYDLTWTTNNLDCPNDLSYITIWYSKDSGDTWGNITTSTDNDGVYNWRLPLFLDGNTYYTPSDKARIKVVAVCSENLMVAGWDMSDADFCPPINYTMLTDEEKEQVEQLLNEGILTIDQLISYEQTPSDITNEEIITEGSTMIVDDLFIVAPLNPTQTEEETNTEETVQEDPIINEEPIIEEEIIEEEIIDNTEATVVEQDEETANNQAQNEEQSVIEEQPANVPDNNSELQTPPADNPSGDGDGGDTADNTAPEESVPVENATQ